MTEGRFVYICAPYSGDIAENRRNAELYAKLAFKRGYIPITPHMMFPFLDDKKAEERAEVLEMCKELAGRCDQVWVFGDRLTAGMMHELSGRLHKVRFMSADVIDIFK